MDSGAVEEIVLVMPEQTLGDHSARYAASARVVAGGATRRESVSLGLAACETADLILVHDAARALTPPVVFERVKSALADGAKAVVPVLPVADTLKRVDESGWVTETLDRSALYAVQTPQGFQAEVLREAHARVPNNVAITDDASMVEWCGIAVTTVTGSSKALKITEPSDVETANLILIGEGQSPK
jgi:2-C-methyl-D-erythritol 4-phosphate cytidylyltransferase